ncbi:MAG: DUF5681 domain-containing protein [Xanthobacteraceae bacterium]
MRRQFGARGKKGEYEVGWGKPPKATRWKPGQSGNPRGRPKGSQAFATVLYEVMRRKLKITENGETRWISFREALGRKLIQNALNGDHKAIKLLIELEPVIMQKGAPTPKIKKNATVEEAQEAYMRMIKAVQSEL